MKAKCSDHLLRNFETSENTSTNPIPESVNLRHFDDSPMRALKVVKYPARHKSAR